MPVQLRGATDVSILVSPGRFGPLIDGLVDLGRIRAVHPSLIVAYLPAAARHGWELVAAVLMANLREVDVLCRLDLETVAVALDAAPPDARKVARRMHQLLGQTFVFEPSWVGLATGASGLGSGADLVTAASDALLRARRDPAGTIVAAG